MFAFAPVPCTALTRPPAHTQSSLLPRASHCLPATPKRRKARLQPATASAAASAGGGGVVGNRVCIEYCTGCRWGLRASWMATELLVTFSDGSLGEVAVRPSDVSGTFNVWVVRWEDGVEKRVWCRKEDGGFPELKELKQRIRDVVAPQRDLGHSDCQSDAPS